jgi:hypothetical protein
MLCYPCRVDCLSYLNIVTYYFFNTAGRHSYDLLYAVVKMAVLSPHSQCLFPLPYYKEEGESEYDVGTVAAELINHLSSHAPPTGNSIPLRYASY